MRAGSRFHRWTVRGVLAQQETVTLFFSAGAFWWCPSEGPKREIAGQCVPIASLTDVFLSVNTHASNELHKRPDGLADGWLADY